MIHIIQRIEDAQGIYPVEEYRGHCIYKHVTVKPNQPRSVHYTIDLRGLTLVSTEVARKCIDVYLRRTNKDINTLSTST